MCRCTKIRDLGHGPRWKKNVFFLHLVIVNVTEACKRIFILFIIVYIVYYLSHILLKILNINTKQVN